MGLGKSCAKLLLIIFNVIFILCGIVLLVVGALLKFGADWLNNQLSRFTDVSFESLLSEIPSSEVQRLLLDSVAPTIGIGMMVLGAFILLLGLLGCCGACKSSKCLLVTYIVLVVIVVVAEIAMTIAFWLLRDKFVELVQPELETSAGKYHTNTADQEFWDVIHRSFQCCGVNNRTDFNHTVPATCCTNSTASAICTSDPTQYYQQGCLDYLINFLDSNKTLVLIVSCSVIFFQLLLILFAACLMRAENKDAD